MIIRPNSQHDCILVGDTNNKQRTRHMNKIIQIVDIVMKRPLPIGTLKVWKLTLFPSHILLPRLGNALLNTCLSQR